MQDNNKPQVVGHDGLPFATEPLRAIVRDKLHPGRDLKANVRRLYYRRRRPAAAKPVEEVQP